MGGNILSSASGTGIGTLTSGAGDILQGVMQARAMRQNAKLDIKEARLQASERIKEGKAQQARQVTQIVKSGFVLSDSPMAIVEQTSLDAEADALKILEGGALRRQQQKGAAVRSIFSGVGKAFGRGAEYMQSKET